MELVTKPDFEEARQRWRAFWQHEIMGRPCAAVRAPKAGVEHVPAPPYMAEARQPPDLVAQQHCRHAEATFWGGEAIPFHDPTFGPDAFAAFLGAELRTSPDSAETSWAVPFVDCWDDILPLRLDLRGDTFARTIALVKAFAEVGKGRLLAGMLDLHSNMDALAAIRGLERLLMDLLDTPELVDRAMAEVRAFYRPVYEAIYEAGDMVCWGTIGWLPFYCEGRFATVQSDVICMLSPRQFRRWVLPALEEECAYLDHSILHLDGPGALVHLEDLLAIKDLDGIQWVPGAGNPPQHEWMDLLKRIQAAGKSLYLSADADLVRLYQRELRPELVFYDCWCATEEAARELLHWLEAHT